MVAKAPKINVTTSINDPKYVADNFDDKGCINTDVEIWRKTEGDFYSPAIYVTKNGGIKISVGGYVITMSIEDWHESGMRYKNTLNLRPEDKKILAKNKYNELKTASFNLIEACLIVIRYYDGTHRMAQAVSDLLRVIANETNNTP